MKKSLAKILKSTNIISYMQQSRQQSLERSYPSSHLHELKQDRDSARKNLAKTFYLHDRKDEEDYERPESDGVEVETENPRAELTPQPDSHRRGHEDMMPEEIEFPGENNVRLEPGQEEFSSVEEENAGQMEAVLRQIPFFGKFVPCRCFRRWKANSMYQPHKAHTHVERLHTVAREKFWPALSPSLILSSLLATMYFEELIQ